MNEQQMSLPMHEPQSKFTAQMGAPMNGHLSSSNEHQSYPQESRQWNPAPQQNFQQLNIVSDTASQASKHDFPPPQQANEPQQMSGAADMDGFQAVRNADGTVTYQNTAEPQVTYDASKFDAPWCPTC